MKREWRWAANAGQWICLALEGFDAVEVINGMALMLREQ